MKDKTITQNASIHAHWIVEELKPNYCPDTVFYYMRCSYCGAQHLEIHRKSRENIRATSCPMCAATMDGKAVRLGANSIKDYIKEFGAATAFALLIFACILLLAKVVG